MTFANTEVTLSDLPAAESIELKPIHKDYLKIIRIEWAITAAVLFIAYIPLVIFIDDIRESKAWWIILISILVLLFIYFFSQEKSFPYKAYAVREKDIIFQKGWIIRTTKVCPFNRIQNCSVHSGPLERKYQLAALTLFTAGSEGADLRIPGLTQEEADNLRYFILNKINGEERVTD